MQRNQGSNCQHPLDHPKKNLLSHLVKISLFCCSVHQSCCSLRPHGLQHAWPPLLHFLPEVAQTHVHWVSDAIQPSRPLSSPSPVFNLSQHQGLFQGVSSLHLAKVLEFQFSASVLPVNIQDWFLLGWSSWISLQSEGLSRVFSNTTVQKHLFFDF